ncbi:hypothetical protein BT69DRAFT_1341640 [Atractiella rhizophila]|nr:hypothetical protein BT69DRAFT_1341640 [Atractiella rhizophila]
MAQIEVYVLSAKTHSQRRFPVTLTISDLQGKLEMITGLGLGEEGELLRKIDLSGEARKTLGEAGVGEGMTIKVLGGYDDDAEEEEKAHKFDITQAEYEKRSDSLLAFKQRNKLGRFGAQVAEPSIPVPEELKSGARCEVEGGRRGTIRFVGETKFSKGTWVGVEYDEPVGKNDGSYVSLPPLSLFNFSSRFHTKLRIWMVDSVDGTRYFEAKDKFGGFIRTDKVKVGDYPVRNIEDEMEEM